MRRQVSAPDGAILFGVILLVFSILGMSFDSTATNGLSNLFGIQEGSGQEIILPAAPTPPAAKGLPVAQAERNVTPFHLVTPTPASPGTAAEKPTADNSSFLVPATPQASPQPTTASRQLPQIPNRIRIPAIQLDAPILPAPYQLVGLDGMVFQQWDAPNEFAAGWQTSSAALGVPGNTVLNGHHNIDGEVFGRLIDLSIGDTIEVYSGSAVFRYVITNKMILPERDQPLSVRLSNARWLQSSTDERLTLVTCWPPNNNTHRLFIVAKPIGKRLAAGGQGP